jgi:uncharacterized damage-inducible protein DinB
MTIRDLVLEEFDEEMLITRKVLSELPEVLPDYKPHAKSMPLAQLAGHIASLPAQAVRVLELDEYEVDMSKMIRFIPSTRAELLERFETNIKDAHSAIERVKEEDLWKTWTFKINGQVIFALPRLKVLRKQVLSHITHHRAQLGVYLRLQELKVPGSYGPSADEMNMFAGLKR